MIRRILLTMVILAMLAESVYCAEIPDDDSAVYSPYPTQPPQNTQPVPTPSPSPKKQPAKKAPKKKTPAKKAPSKKSSSSRRKPATVRQSSLEKGIELMQKERYEQAKPYLLKAIQENRNDPNAWYWYGVYHEKTGGFYQAQYFYSKAVTIDPAFEPLSRVVFYPNDPEKTPLWDPKHPARVYPVETASVPMNVSRFPNAPDDPEIPQVPVYTPPEPGTSPLDGDSWNPAVYVPPSPEELPEYNQPTLYTPPNPGAIVADERTVDGGTVTDYQPRNDDIITDHERIMRVDKPVYNPPEPGQRVSQPPKTKTEQPRQTVKIPAKKDTQPKKTATIPSNRVVRQKKSSAAPAKTVRQRKSQKKAESQDVTPTPKPRRQTPTQRNQTSPATQRQKTPAPTQRQQTPPPTPPQETPPPVRQPETVQPQRRQSEYMPPVGQYTPDPGTIPDRPMPPVGQGNQN